MWLKTRFRPVALGLFSFRVEGTLSPCPFFHRELEVPLPDIDYVEIPADWWDAEADKSLLIGVFKHGECVMNVFSLLRNSIGLLLISLRKWSFMSVLSEIWPDNV